MTIGLIGWSVLWSFLEEYNESARGFIQVNLFIFIWVIKLLDISNADLIAFLLFSSGSFCINWKSPLLMESSVFLWIGFFRLLFHISFTGFFLNYVNLVFFLTWIECYCWLYVIHLFFVEFLFQKIWTLKFIKCIFWYIFKCYLWFFILYFRFSEIKVFFNIILKTFSHEFVFRFWQFCLRKIDESIKKYSIWKFICLGFGFLCL